VILLPEEYIVSKFYQYAGSPKYNRGTNVYQGSCPICREGTSWLKKQRCYYIVKNNAIHCHNCGWHGNPINWIMENGGQTFSEVMKESQDYDTIKIDDNGPVRKKIDYELPCDCIDLEDEEQVDFFRNEFPVKKALEVLKSRRLLEAINKPKKYYFTLNDFTHQNRIIIPFYDENNKIIYYQSRKVIEGDQKPKYLSKKNAERSVFNIDKVVEDIPFLFVTEGPLDATFVKNGVAVAGISETGGEVFTPKQKEQLKLFPFHEIIYVLDNQWTDHASKSKSKALLENGKRVFIWPKEYFKFKDLNDVCAHYKLNEFPYKFIESNSYSGMTGKVRLSQIS
jgi:DNA primase